MPNLFAMTGAVPMLGRSFTADEHDVAILSHALFQRRFGGNADMVGKSIRLDDRNFNVVGVLPAGFAFSEIAESPDVWIPLERNRDGEWGAMSMLGKLRPGVTMGAAQSALDAVAGHLEETLKLYRGPNGEDAGYGVKIVSLRDQMLGEFRLGTWILLCAVAAVLLIALVNLAHLMLVRAVSREKEFAVRRAIGATDARLIRQWMTEGALLSALGGSLGAMASIWGVRALVALSPAALPGVAKIADTRALAVTLAISAMVCVVSGLAPLRAAAGDCGNGACSHAADWRGAAAQELRPAQPRERGVPSRASSDHASGPAARFLSGSAAAHRILRFGSRSAECAAWRAGGERGEPATGERPESEWQRGRSVQHRGTAVESVERGSAVCAHHGRGSRLFSRDADPAAGGPRVQWRGRREFAARRGDQ
jgi:uncharacterized low-complexity protein